MKAKILYILNKAYMFISNSFEELFVLNFFILLNILYTYRLY